MTERGTLLGGRYELDQIIGRGGMPEGVVGEGAVVAAARS